MTATITTIPGYDQLLDLRNRAEKIDNGDKERLERLERKAVAELGISQGLARDIIQQGCEIARQAKSYPVWPQGFPTAQSTIDALLFELRSGLSALKDPGCLDRLKRCDKQTMRAIAKELLSWKFANKPYLPAWSNKAVGKLLKIWREVRK